MPSRAKHQHFFGTSPPNEQPPRPPTNTMASPTATLETLAAALTATREALPDLTLLTAPKNGLSLLTAKNDLLLTYLHNLSYLTLLRLRSTPITDHPIITDLIRTRLLLERGTKPLEARLKYQIDRAVSAATAPEPIAPAPRAADSDSSDSEAEAAPAPAASASDLSFRPNPASLAAPKPTLRDTRAAAPDGIYRPPRIAATAMPTSAPREKQSGPIRSRALEDFVADELSTAPLAEPSIGTTIAGAGRVVKSAQDRREEAERREYEESNFVRLPKLSKKEAQQQKKRGQNARDNAMGGEDWRSFAGDLDKLTKRTEKASKGERVLEKSRKRGGEERDGGEESRGRVVGEHFEGRKKGMAKRRKV